MRLDNLIILNVRTKVDQAIPIVVINAIPHARLPLFQLLFTESFYSVFYTRIGRGRDKFIFSACELQ